MPPPAPPDSRNLRSTMCGQGSATTHNGRSATLTAPNGVSQRATMTAALREANLLPAEVGRISCPIEALFISEVNAPAAARLNRRSLGS